jgi:hypothetical protein
MTTLGLKFVRVSGRGLIRKELGRWAGDVVVRKVARINHSSEAISAFGKLW